MALSAIDDQAKQPAMGELNAMLGRSSSHWNNLISHIATEYAPLDEIWNFAGEKWGWSLRLKRKKRTVLYMTPCRKHFLVGLVLGGKAITATRDAGLPDEILTIIDSAPKYGEGTGVRIEIRKKADLEPIRKLAAMKMAN